ncbi:MAG TPA: NAD(P)H-dependent oxidoreductase [Reyranella sp.]|nr:NAD(P)H-dependent oxidoreductase [Reyranella sp.]
MPRNILVLNGHPDPSNKGLCHVLAQAYEEGAVNAGHVVRHLDVAELDFGFLRSQAAFEKEAPPPAIAAAQESILWANHLVVIFPLWLGDMPAILKAFFEQALRPGFAFTYRPSGFPVMHLKGRSARIIVTMGMPAPIYRWYFRAHGLKNLKRNVLRFVGFAPVHDTIIGSVGTRSRESIARSVAKTKSLGQRAA